MATGSNDRTVKLWKICLTESGTFRHKILLAVGYFIFIIEMVFFLYIKKRGHHLTCK